MCLCSLQIETTGAEAYHQIISFSLALTPGLYRTSPNWDGENGRWRCVTQMNMAGWCLYTSIASSPVCFCISGLHRYNRNVNVGQKTPLQPVDGAKPNASGPDQFSSQKSTEWRGRVNSCRPKSIVMCANNTHSLSDDKYTTRWTDGLTGEWRGSFWPKHCAPEREP